MININYSIEEILEYKPCEDGADWLKTQPDLATAWQNCHRIDWMLWFLDVTGQLSETLDLQIQLMVLETPLEDGGRVLDLITDQRSLDYIDLKRKRLAGNPVDGKQWAAAGVAAWDAAWAAAWVAAWDAAWVAAWVAAKGAARVAARVAAWGAAGGAAGKWQADELRKLVEVQV